MTKIHQYTKSKVKGDLGEDTLVTYYSNLGYKVTKTNLSIQKSKLNPYDLLITKRNLSFLLEIKTEYVGESTGNLFFETEVGGKLGWCKKYTKDSNVVIVWYLPISKKLIYLPAYKLVSIDLTKYRQRVVSNVDQGITKGYLVPIKDVEKIGAVIWL